MKNNNERWLCRNCNTFVDNNIATCPKCSADRPEDSNMEPTPEGIATVITCDGYTDNSTEDKPQYLFRESVLINSADIILVLGLFCTVASLLAPIFINNIENITLWSICAAVALFALTMILWATLRTLGDISYRLRIRDKQ